MLLFGTARDRLPRQPPSPANLTRSTSKPEALGSWSYDIQNILNSHSSAFPARFRGSLNTIWAPVVWAQDRGSYPIPPSAHQHVNALPGYRAAGLPIYFFKCQRYFNGLLCLRLNTKKHRYWLWFAITSRPQLNTCNNKQSQSHVKRDHKSSSRSLSHNQP